MSEARVWAQLHWRSGFVWLRRQPTGLEVIVMAEALCVANSEELTWAGSDGYPTGPVRGVSLWAYPDAGPCYARGSIVGSTSGGSNEYFTIPRHELVITLPDLTGEPEPEQEKRPPLWKRFSRVSDDDD